MSKVKTLVTLTVMDEYELQITDYGLRITDDGLRIAYSWVWKCIMVHSLRRVDEMCFRPRASAVCLISG